MDRREHILVVVADVSERERLTEAIEADGMAAVVAGDAASARRLLADRSYALVLVDDNLPDARANELVGEFGRSHDAATIILTSSQDEHAVVGGLDAGADDFVRRPFGTRELLARIRAVLRRTRGPAAALQPTINVGPITLDAKGYRANIDGEPLPLTPTEYRLLAFLVQNVGRVLTHDQLLGFVWGPGYHGEHHMLHVTMSRLRQKLRRLSDPNIIRTSPGVGYEFVPEASN